MAIIGKLLRRGIRLGSIVTARNKVNAIQLQRKTLSRLLSKARYTRFGKEYHFEEILGAALFRQNLSFYELFKQHVPIYDYNKMYQEWWHLLVAGEKDVCWPGKVRYFALSSGTSEASSKQIPVTSAMSRAIQRTSIRQILTLGRYKDLPDDLYEKGFLMLGGSTDLHMVGGRFEGDLSGITASQIPFWFRPYYKPGLEIASKRDWEQKLTEITLQAKNWDIGFIVGVPAWLQLLMERIIAHYEVDNIHAIWPNLKVFAHGGVSFEPYRKGFEKLLARPLVYIETYLASEGFLAYQTHPEAKGMRLVLDNGIFFEFIPFNEQNFDSEGNLTASPETLMFHETVEGKEYALLISTCSGAWRYLIGDTIKFVNKDSAEIIITGRTKHFLSLCGEHLSVDNMNKALDLVAEKMGIAVREFTVAGKTRENRFAHHWYIGTNDTPDPAILQEEIDRHLKILNDDYAVERRHALKDITVTVLPVKTFYGWMEKKGKMGGQHKFPRVMKNHMINEWELYLKENGFDV